MLLRLNQLHGQHVEGKSHLGLGDVRVVGPVLDPHQVVVVGEVDGPAAVQDGFGGDVVAVTVVAASAESSFGTETAADPTSGVDSWGLFSSAGLATAATPAGKIAAMASRVASSDRANLQKKKRNL